MAAEGCLQNFDMRGFMLADGLERRPRFRRDQLVLRERGSVELVLEIFQREREVEHIADLAGQLRAFVIGRKAGSVAGYSYSAANKDSGITWDEATFREYIKDPKAKIPGTKMIYAGLKDEQKTNDLVAFLKQFDADGKKK